MQIKYVPYVIKKYVPLEFGGTAQLIGDLVSNVAFPRLN